VKSEGVKCEEKVHAEVFGRHCEGMRMKRVSGIGELIDTLALHSSPFTETGGFNQ
jgi:hypothetical protein